MAPVPPLDSGTRLPLFWAWPLSVPLYLYARECAAWILDPLPWAMPRVVGGLEFLVQTALGSLPDLSELLPLTHLSEGECGGWGCTACVRTRRPEGGLLAGRADRSAYVGMSRARRSYRAGRAWGQQRTVDLRQEANSQGGHFSDHYEGVFFKVRIEQLLINSFFTWFIISVFRHMECGFPLELCGCLISLPHCDFSRVSAFRSAPWLAEDGAQGVLTERMWRINFRWQLFTWKSMKSYLLTFRAHENVLVEFGNKTQGLAWVEHR